MNYSLWQKKIKEIDQFYSNNVFQNIVKKSDKMAVIVEPRKHQHLSGVLKNFASKLGNDWSMTIFYGTENYEFIRDIIGSECNIKLEPLHLQNLSISSYNKLLMSNFFWNKLDSKKILIFQSDCLLRRTVNEFLSYHYIGAPWCVDNPLCRYINGSCVGNGGLSIRDKNASLYILNKYSKYSKYLKYKLPYVFKIEDIFFSYFFERCGFNIANMDVASKFSTEEIFSDAAGMHKSYDSISNNQMKQLLNFEI